MNKYYLALLSFVLFICGCTPSNRPTDLPKLHPCTLSFTMEGKPLDEASITLYSNDPTLAKWSAGGITDATGKVILQTNGQFSGAPAGSFKIVVLKDTKPTPDDPNRDPNTPPPPQKPTKSLVDLNFTKAETSPLEITIVEGHNEEKTFDVKPAK